MSSADSPFAHIFCQKSKTIFLLACLAIEANHTFYGCLHCEIQLEQIGILSSGSIDVAREFAFVYLKVVDKELQFATISRSLPNNFHCTTKLI